MHSTIKHEKEAAGKHLPSLHHKEDSQYEVMDESTQKACKSALYPVFRSLHKLQKGNTGLDKHEWAKVLRDELMNVGDHIESETKKMKAGDDPNRIRKHLWSYAGRYWPSKVPSSKISEMYRRLKLKTKE